MSINDSVYVTDMNDKIVFVNKAFCKTYEYREEDVTGMDSNMLWKGVSTNEGVKDILPGTIEEGSKGEYYHRRKDGSEFPISLTRSVVKDENGNEVTVVGVACDITEGKRVEEVLREAYDELERRVEKQTAELSKANELLMQVNTERRRAEALLVRQKKRREERKWVSVF